MQKPVTRLLLLVAVALALGSAAQARERAQGFCTRGGITLTTQGISGTPQVMASYAQCSVAVYQTGTNTPATLYSDNSSTPLSNPFTADTRGYWFFYADCGRYDIQLSGGGNTGGPNGQNFPGFPVPFTLGDVDLCPATSGGGNTSGAPAVCSAGQVFFDTVLETPTVPANTFFICIATNTWSEISGSVPSGALTPTACLVGSLFYNTVLGQLLYCSAPNVFTQATGISLGATLPATCTNGASFFNTANFFFYLCTDTNLWVQLGGAVSSGATNPATCTVGTLFYNTAQQLVFVCFATNTWTQVLGITIGGTLPASCSPNQFIFDFTAGEFFYGLPNGTCVQANASQVSSGSSNPSNCSPGQIFFNTSNGTLYICVSGTFVAVSGGSVNFPNVKIYYVTSTSAGSDTNPGTSWLLPFATEGAAVTACASTQCLVYVGPGYTGSVPASVGSNVHIIEVAGDSGSVQGAQQLINQTFATAKGYGNGVVSILLPNAAVTGTTLFKLAQLSGAPSSAVITTVGSLTGSLGIVVDGAGTSGTATVALIGQVSCVFDGATTAGDYIIPSAITAGDCHDGGATYPANVQVVGRVLSTNASAGTYFMSLDILSSSGRAGALGSQCQGPAPFGTVCSAPYSVANSNVGINQVAACRLVSNGTQQSFSCTLPQPVVAQANEQLLVFGHVGTASLNNSTVTDTLGNTFAHSLNNALLFIAPVTTGGVTDTVTLNCKDSLNNPLNCESSPNVANMGVMELVNASGVHASGAFAGRGVGPIAAAAGDLLVEFAGLEGDPTDSRCTQQLVFTSVPAVTKLYDTSATAACPQALGVAGAATTTTFSESWTTVTGNSVGDQSVMASIDAAGGSLVGPNSYKTIVGSQLPGGAGAQIMSTTQVVLGANTSVSPDVDLLTAALTMPVVGCPCRVVVSYGLYASATSSGSWRADVNDGTNHFATANFTTLDSTSPALNANETSPVAYSNSQAVTFKLHVGGPGSILSATGSATWPEKSYLTLTVLPSAN